MARGVLLLIAAFPPAAPGHAQGRRATDTLAGTPARPVTAKLEAHLRGSDSVTVRPGETEPAGAVHRLLFGDLNRELWTLPVTVPVLDLDAVGGGLEAGGAPEGSGVELCLTGRDGTMYRFRSLTGTTGEEIPAPLRGTPAEGVLRDQVAARFPLSVLVVAELLGAVGIPVGRPSLVALPDHPRLEEHRREFGGRIGWIEPWPPGGHGTSGVVDTDELLRELRRNPMARVNARSLLKARLVDMFVGDWDRGPGRWRWARHDEADGRVRWEPVPGDPDWALSRVDGLLPDLTSVYYPRLVGFGREYADVTGLSWRGQAIDRNLLPGLGREDFRKVAAEVQGMLADPVLERAVEVLPRSYVDLVGADLMTAFRHRRERLPDVAERFYELLAGWVDVRGTGGADSVLVTSPGPDLMRVRALVPGYRGLVRFDRTFTADETREVRIYLYGGDDRMVIEGPRPLPIHLRIVGGDGDDRYIDGTDGSDILLYDEEGQNTVELGEHALVTDDALLVQDSLRTADAVWETRDWGTALVPRPVLHWDSDVGLFVGAGLDRYTFGFGIRPYLSRLSVSVSNGLRAGEWMADVELERALGPGGWRALLDIDVFTGKPTWFFGFGDDVAPSEDEETYRTVRDHVSVDVRLRFVADTTWSASAGVTLSRAGAVEPGGRLFDELAPYGSADFTDLGLHAGLQVDTRDRRSLPTRGVRGEVELRVHPSLFDAVETFGGLGSSLVAVTSVGPLTFQSALHARVAGRRLWGRAPYHRLPSLGGSSTLPGYVLQRFLGHSVASGAGLVRLKVADLHVVSDLSAGVHGLATTGRVWSELGGRGTWHHGVGAGAWLHAPSLDRTVNLTVVWGEGAPRAYLGFGSIF